MASKQSSLAGCTAHVYDTWNNLLVTTKVTDYDPEWMEIEIEECPDIKQGDTCRLLILSLPSPREYMGTVKRKMKMSATIAIYRGKEMENRKHRRYKVKVTALIETVIRAGGPHEIQLPLAAQLVDLSKGGARVSSAAVLAAGDRFEMCLKAEKQEKRLFAEVVSVFRTEQGGFEYGCRFVKKE